MHGELSLASYNIKVLDLKVLVRWHQHMIPRLQGCKYSSTNCHFWCLSESPHSTDSFDLLFDEVFFSLSNSLL